MNTKKVNMVKVEGTAFVRDTSTMALSNTDFTSRNEYFLKAKLIRTQKEEINKINTEITEIRSDISDVKNLLIQLLEGRNG
jgi:gluconate kinase